VTDQKDQSWRGVQWGLNISHEENNSNYYFGVYETLNTALFMYPYHEDIDQPKFWRIAEPFNSKKYRIEIPKVTTLEPIQVTLPTNKQRINFAILACLFIVSNKSFREWAKAYLLEEPTDDPITVVKKIQISTLQGDVPTQDDYISCVHPCLNAIMMENPNFFAAASAHRAFYDSPENDPINLTQIADISLSISNKEIAQTILK